jgi:hypothetical protein
MRLTNPVGMDEGVRRYKRKSLASPVFESGIDTCECRFPAWRRRRGVLALSLRSLGVGSYLGHVQCIALEVLPRSFS